MRRIGTVLLWCVLLSFGLSANGVWAFSKKPALPSSKMSTVQHPVMLNVTEDVSARTLHTKRWHTDNQQPGSSQSQKSSYTEIRPGLHVLTPIPNLKMLIQH